jgi:hypothetical protein
MRTVPALDAVVRAICVGAPYRALRCGFPRFADFDRVL